MKSECVSVVMPAFNAGAFIAESIQSVQRQTHQNWELIIVDDGSTDGTTRIVREFVKSDSRIRLIRFPRNTGLAAAGRNAAMRQSRGAFIAFLDADDLWLPEKLSEQLKVFGMHSQTAVVCTWYDVFGDEERARLWREMLWRFDTEVVAMEQLLQQSLTTPTVMMRRECFEEIGGFVVSRKLATGEDYEYWIRLAGRYEVRRVCRPLARVRVHEHGSSLSTRELEKKNFRDRELYRRVVRGNALTQKQKRAYTSIYFYNRARNALFHFHQPFRRDLYRSVATGHAPPKALVMAALSFLPAPALKSVLKALLKITQSRAGDAPG